MVGRNSHSKSRLQLGIGKREQQDIILLAVAYDADWAGKRDSGGESNIITLVLNIVLMAY